MRIVIADVQVPFMRGGAELLAEGLRAACEAAGHQAEIIRLPFRFFPTADVRRCIAAWKAEDLRSLNLHNPERVIALRFPAYCLDYPGRVTWLLHQYRGVYDLWDETGASEEERALRQAIHDEDALALAPPHPVFTISRNVSARLLRYNGVAAPVLYHPPPLATRLYCAEALPYIFTVSRLESLKRIDLLIRAMIHVESPVVALIAGEGSHSQRFKELVVELGLQHRVRFLGRLGEDELLAYYAHATAVFFAPHDEDYGYVTLEAMLAAKPVITCTDAGGPLEFVVEGETGRIAAPEPRAVAAAIDDVCADPQRAARMGVAGRESYLARDIGWPNVVERLLA
ncbi:MAG: glycosyltransferase family 4 protein [Sterolibacterium sp.]|nr:glycosyltransferase family 4 protein [Sterolibacterium sp.]